MRPCSFLWVVGLSRFFGVRRRYCVRRIKTGILLGAFLLSVFVVSFASAFAGAQTQVLHGHVPKVTRNLSPEGRLDANRQLHLAIGLPLRNGEQLTNLLEDVYNPSSSNFRHFLRPDEFAASFGPSAEDHQSIIDFANAHHLKVTHTHPNRTLIDVSGSVADIENAFHIHLMTFKHPKEDRDFFAPDAEPSLDLATPVLAISGLDSYVRPQPRIHPALTALQPYIKPQGGGGSGGGGGGNNPGPFQGYDFRNAYTPNAAQVGAGQSVGLFELFAFSAQDIQDYEDESGIYPYVNVQPILIDGASGDDSSVDWVDDSGYLDYAFEVTGDIEMAIAMAPGLQNVLVYIGPTPQDVPPLGTNYIQDATTTAQINDVLNQMATDDLAQQLSCSYGMDINLSTIQIFQQYAAQGQSFFLASGDGGAFPGAIDEPADDPFITVVGGTTLTTSTSTGAWSSEVTWLSPPSDDGLGDVSPLEASGGGISTVYAIPSWQQGISMTINQGSTTMRNLPDVASVANNVIITWGNDFIGESFDWPEGGTSLAAPVWAGFTAMVNQQAAANNRPPVGFINPALYAIGKSTSYHSCFHDITSGANTNGSSPTKYYASAGYDLCTGWGTISTNLLGTLLVPPLDNLSITSAFGFTAQGPSGGPFSVTNQTFTLLNTGSSSIAWTLGNNVSWLTVSSTGGKLNPGGSTTVTVSLNANADSFMIMHASGNLTFSNLNAGTAQNRQFDLYVGNGGFETGVFTDWTMVGDPTLNFGLSGDDFDVAGEDALPGQPDELFVHSGLYGGYLGEWPDTGSLSQTIPTPAGRQLLISFWLTSVPDDNGDTTPNGFDAKWNGATLFTGTNLAAFGWTNMQYVVSSAGTSGTLEFDFNNTPGAFGLDDVTVQTLPGPMLNSMAVTSGKLTFGWSTYPNVLYQIQTSTNLASTNWANVGSPMLATNSAMQISLSIGAGSKQFYRVAILPP
jgi:subtilase family serine protease